jgi:hypothetical protein
MIVGDGSEEVWGIKRLDLINFLNFIDWKGFFCILPVFLKNIQI